MTLPVTLLICGILGILMLSYLSIVQSQHLSVTRAQSWNSAIVTAEAGIEEGLAQLNAAGVSTNNLGTNGWTDLGGGTYRKTNSVGGNSYVASILISPAVTNPYPVVVSTGYVAGPISGPALVRSVRLNTRPRPALGVGSGIVMKSTVDFSGQGVTVDSFNSSNTNYSTGGLYDPAKARDQAIVTSLSNATNAISLGNGDIEGTVHTAPGGVVDFNGGSVGDANWVTNGNQGIETGHDVADASGTLGDVVLPDETWMTPLAGHSKIGGFQYKYVLDDSSPWEMTALDNSLYVSGTNVILYVNGDVKISSGMQIYVAPGAKLTMYVSGSTSIGGNGVINPSGQAQDFSYYGLPSNTSVDMNANANFVGTIYAPEADVSLGGGGSNYYDFIGSAVGNSLKMNGHFHIHYDEALADVPAYNGYLANSWDEI